MRSYLHHTGPLASDPDGTVQEEYAFLLALRPGRSYYQSVPIC
jgi:hypothetical protein